MYLEDVDDDDDDSNIAASPHLPPSDTPSSSSDTLGGPHQLPSLLLAYQWLLRLTSQSPIDTFDLMFTPNLLDMVEQSNLYVMGEESIVLGLTSLGKNSGRTLGYRYALPSVITRAKIQPSTTQL